MSASQADIDYRAFYDNTYVRAWDLPVGRDVTMVIERVEQAEIKGTDKTERRPIVFFKGARKGLVLNKGMGKTIKGIYGARVSGWVGQPISLYATTCAAFGETHDVIRIRPTAPSKKRSAPNKPAAALPEAPVADAEFVESESQEVAS